MTNVVMKLIFSYNTIFYIIRSLFLFLKLGWWQCGKIKNDDDAISENEVTEAITSKFYGSRIAKEHAPDTSNYPTPKLEDQIWDRWLQLRLFDISCLFNFWMIYIFY